MNGPDAAASARASPPPLAGPSPGALADRAAVPARPLPADLGRVLLCLPNWLGDIVMARPAVQAMAEALPEAVFVAQAPRPFLPLAAALPGVHQVLPAPSGRGLGELLAARARLKAQRFDAAVVFARGHRAALAPWLARIPARVGFGARGKGPLFTHAVRDWRPLRAGHRSLFFAALTAPFGVRADPEGVGPLALPEGAREGARRLLLALGRQTARPLVALEAGASYGPAKCWPADHFAALAAALGAGQDVDVVTVGTPAAAATEARIAARAPGLLRGVGRTGDLGLLMGLLAEADVLVTNDTGPMHLAAALGTPVVALFGATDPGVSRPLGPGTLHLIHEPEPCSPCFLRDCPIAGHPCLSKIPPERALGAVRDLLGT